MSWHSFQVGENYSVEEITQKLEERINSGKVQNPEEKRFNLQSFNRVDDNQLQFQPQREQGWGASPLNPKNWTTISGVRLKKP